MIFQQPNPAAVNQRQKALAQRLVQKVQANGMNRAQAARGGFGGSAGGSGGGAGSGGVPFRGLGQALQARLSTNISGPGGIPQSILARMGIGGRGFAGRDFGTQEGQGMDSMPFMPQGFQGSQAAPDAMQQGQPQMPQQGAAGPPPDYMSGGVPYFNAPAASGVTSYGGFQQDPNGQGFAPASDVMPMQPNQNNLVHLGGGRYYDPTTDSVRGGAPAGGAAGLFGRGR